MRAFLALAVPEQVARALIAVSDRLTVGNVVPEEDLHLTLAFLGEVRADTLDDMALDLEMLQPGPQRLEVTGLDTFGSTVPRSLHARIAADPCLLQLRRKVATLVRRAGVDLRHSRFVPHVTLARFSRAMTADDLARIGRFLSAEGGLHLDPAWSAGLGLYRSTLSHAGARYDLLETFPPG